MCLFWLMMTLLMISYHLLRVESIKDLWWILSGGIALFVFGIIVCLLESEVLKNGSTKTR